MIENFITQARIIQGEPALEDYLRSGQSSFNEVSAEAYDEYLCDMKDRQIDLRRLGLRLDLPDDESVSAEDTVERRRIVITTDGAMVFTLKGCKTADGTFEDVSDIVITAAGEHTELFYKTFKFYKLERTDGTGVYSAYLYETTFDYPLLYLIRSKVYFSIYHRSGDDAFREKSEHYKKEYQMKVADKPASHYYYDFNDDGKVSDYEASKPAVHKITIRP